VPFLLGVDRTQAVDVILVQRPFVVFTWLNLTEHGRVFVIPVLHETEDVTQFMGDHALDIHLVRFCCRIRGERNMLSIQFDVSIHDFSGVLNPVGLGVGHRDVGVGPLLLPHHHFYQDRILILRADFVLVGDPAVLQPHRTAVMVPRIQRRLERSFEVFKCYLVALRLVQVYRNAGVLPVHRRTLGRYLLFPRMCAPGKKRQGQHHQQ